ncbi:hypothetical protein Dimus_028662 [Dionaea muscipula]
MAQDPTGEDVVDEVAQAAATDTVAPPEVIVDEASKTTKEEVIKTKEATDEDVLNKKDAEREAEKEVDEEVAKNEPEKEAEQEKEVEKEAEMEKDDVDDSVEKMTEDKIPKDEDKIAEASKDVKTRFELMESKLKVTELDLSMKITMVEGNLGQKIDANSTRLSSVEETLAGLLKVQQEQNETNKALMIS